MNEIVVIGGKLALICVVAALCLGLVNAVTAPAIVRVKAQQLAEALEDVALGGTVGDAVEIDDNPNVTSYYPLHRSSGSGYITRLIGIGYGGEIVLLASYSLDGEVLSVKLMDNQETPGLGKEAERDEYMAKYLGTGAGTPVPTAKSDLSQAEVDSITGATITFMGIGDALNKGSEFVRIIGASNE